MESLTRLVSESLARHGFQRPVDYRRLHWSRWFRCESHHSLLSVPSKPGVFAIAEAIMDLGNTTPRVGAHSLVLSARVNETKGSTTAAMDYPEPDSAALPGAETESRKPQGRMLAVSKFFEDEDMAFTLDHMLSWQNPERARLESGRYFVRYVVIEDQAQRRSICNALNQWIASSTELATGIGAHFASSLELPTSEANVPRGLSPAAVTSRGDCAVATDIHCPSLFPSGF